MKILIAEDSSTSRMMLVAVTKKWGYEVVEAEDGLVAWEIMQQEDAPRLLIIDWEMPNMDGIELCERVRAKESTHPPYILLLTGRTGAEDIVKGLSKGANDYVSKPFNQAELQARMQVGQRMLEMQSKLYDAMEELRTHATYDALTGILNRRAVLEQIPKEIQRVRRQGSALCIGMCDIDYFKKINDTHGHLVGDEVLKEVTKRMQSALRAYDLVGRFGGEEFLVVTSLSEDHLLDSYNRICETLSATPIRVGELSLNVTISCGVTKLLKDDCENDYTDILARADAALYKAKKSGRNKVIFK
jgi:two-component system, cell cycle response regulator